jgi:hypothetical protein
VSDDIGKCKVRCETTDYGFEWGAVEVLRHADHEKKGWVWLGLKTPKAEIDIHVTKGGKMYIYPRSGKPIWEGDKKGETP